MGQPDLGAWPQTSACCGTWSWTLQMTPAVFWCLDFSTLVFLRRELPVVQTNSSAGQQQKPSLSPDLDVLGVAALSIRKLTVSAASLRELLPVTMSSPWENLMSRKKLPVLWSKLFQLFHYSPCLRLQLWHIFFLPQIRISILSYACLFF